MNNTTKEIRENTKEFLNRLSYKLFDKPINELNNEEINKLLNFMISLD